ncbi:hypothetical protein SD71_09850 [Cohnella kolymensis]|uniref:Resolvase/invertase-type recombinase catalytic domain-containing protein n=1 Tax=Cohnella kolymensis TaxID=1590652 RepID=A0ABR5A5N2_9BACL|nr:hypothetical protein [Cohnella kolymensis]KIL36232.1 hypothetical protein SD71_09850 [Cohnella kolymensis]
MSTPRNIDKEEMACVKDFLILPLMLDYIDADMKAIQQAGLKTDLILIQELKKAQSRAVDEHILIKRTLRERGIKVFSIRNSSLGIYAEYLCRNTCVGVK